MSAPSPAEAARRLGTWLDPQGRLTGWPAKRSLQVLAACYLVAKFEGSRRYSEPEVNAILDTWSLFRDAARLRRDMVDLGLLGRTPDGREYWLEPAPEPR
ncbi:MAG: DUF2087 domain-containing protein [Dehalococcoidia bacterium]|nr:DUF2087 domain-containing protein [Dehalococcoidia bacterium]MCZ7578998.1 DUF2087 domain-containing protein [Dehalococcoidia bacterium]